MNKTLIATMLALALTAVATPVNAEEDLVTVNLTVDFGLTSDDVRECETVVPAGANAGDVLDQAALDGCIASWAFETYDPYGRFVTAIDDVEGDCSLWPALCTYWEFRVDGETASHGIDFYAAEDGSEIAFVYTIWPTGDVY